MCHPRYTNDSDKILQILCFVTTVRSGNSVFLLFSASIAHQAIVFSVILYGEGDEQGLHSVFERFRAILHEGQIDKRVQFMIEGLFAVRKGQFEGFPAVLPELDLVEEDDQITHEISLDDTLVPETHLDVFKVDPNFEENEKAYAEIKKEILGESEEDDDDGSDDSDDDDDDESEGSDEETRAQGKTF